jgi:hypothetical protein
MAMAIVASNALALVQAAMRQQDGREAVEELSCYHLVLFVPSVWEGMHIVVATPSWRFVCRFCAAQLAQWLCELAHGVGLDPLRRSPRGPKNLAPSALSAAPITMSRSNAFWMPNLEFRPVDRDGGIPPYESGASSASGIAVAARSTGR